MLPRQRSFRLVALLVAGIICPASALAGGGSQNVILIADPEDPASVYLTNYYRGARNVPERNVFYFKPGAANYTTFVTDKLDSLFGMLAHRQIDDHIDFILIMPTNQYRVSASGLISDGCSSVSNFSIASCYLMAFLADEIQNDDLNSQDTNRYYSGNDTARAFDSSTGWLGGSPNNTSGSRRYFCAGMLGYTGNNGNTVEEIVDLIDRSVAADFTRPAGTFYFCKTNDVLRSGPRDPFFAAAISAIESAGGDAMQLNESDTGEVLPIGHDDCLGVMTGAASPQIVEADMTILDGAFGDHLTSFAGHFDTGSQTKMSEWITKGASGTCGTVEEPCNYPGKFPHPRMHVYYYKEVNLGEACFRSLGFTPFQPLIYGDIMTQPFAYKPTVTWPTPTEPLSGTIQITPDGSTNKPGADIDHFELYINGKYHSSKDPGQSFNVNTTKWPDGLNEFRVIGVDDSLIETQNRKIKLLTIDNLGRSATVSADPTTGGRDTLFDITVMASGGDVAEIRLMANDRVYAATQSDSATLSIYGDMFGAGPVRLYAVAEFTDGKLARSAFQIINIDYNTAPANSPTQPPVAYSFIKDVPANTPFILELPASDPDTSSLTYSITQSPSQATLAGTGRTRLVRPNDDALGEDTVQFKANDGGGDSNIATVTLRYTCPAIDITQQPQDDDVCMNGTATLSVVVDGNGPFAYQWQKDGIDLPDETNDMLTITGVNNGDEGFYAVVVTSECRSRTSDPAFVDVISGTPTITDHPDSATVCAGDAVTFSVTATGEGDLSYQWRKDGVNIPDATEPTYTIDPVQPGDAGNYRCRVTNACGNKLSNIAVLTVEQAPGDMNGDCVVDAADVPIFTDVLLGYESDPGLVDLADLNDDGSADGDDLQPFVDALL